MLVPYYDLSHYLLNIPVGFKQVKKFTDPLGTVLDGEGFNLGSDGLTERKVSF